MALLITALLAAAAAQPATLPEQQPAACPRTQPHYAARPGEQARMHRLTDLPDASAYSAVLRQVGGCEAPVLIKQNVSGKKLK